MQAVAARSTWLVGLSVALLSVGCAAESEGGGGGFVPPSGLGGSGGTGAAPSAPLGPVAGTTGGVAGQGGTGGTGPDQPALEAPMPCDVATVVASRCQTCHGETPIGGAPMPLVSQADFLAPAYSDATKTVLELSQARTHDVARPMPPGQLLQGDELAVLDAWLAAGAPAGTEADRSCGTPAQPDAGTGDPVVTDPDEVCYELHMHGQPVANDTTPYTIRNGEYYMCFFYDVPWDQPVEGTRFGNAFDNEPVLHHWLLYTTSQAQPNGAIVECGGTHIGDNSQMLAGWAVGGGDVEMPADTGFVLPDSGKLLVEWHLYNTTGAPVGDTSGLKICTVPKGTRPRDASITWLGTENLHSNGIWGGMAPGVQTDFSGTCNPGRAGMNTTDPIHIFTFLPHMHKLGRNMRSVINRLNGTKEEVFNKPFDFNYQIHYPVSVDLYPGETITSTCTFFNDTNAGVPFGNSSDQEMCYQFAFSSPAGALHNGVAGLNGASNNCW